MLCGRYRKPWLLVFINKLLRIRIICPESFRKQENFLTIVRRYFPTSHTTQCYSLSYLIILNLYTANNNRHAQHNNKISIFIVKTARGKSISPLRTISHRYYTPHLIFIIPTGSQRALLQVSLGVPIVISRIRTPRAYYQ